MANRNVAGGAARRWFINHVVMREIMGWRVRTRVLRLLGMDLGRGSGLSAGCWVGGIDIVMGDRSGCNIGCTFDNLGPIRIGNDVAIGHQVMLLTSHHDVRLGEHKAMGAVAGHGITIHDGVWIGARATVMPGVTIGEGCMIGAGAVVTKDCEPRGMYLGVPARRVKDLVPAEPVPAPDEPVPVPAA
jgi:acetyltransferase-like isoleucine patch superfamily enzyme